jgi:D-amino-acid dehydrogenase
MQICILGAGALGVMTAYFLEQNGHKVTIIERQPEAAMETSFANGGQLSYSHAEPWANPAVLPKIVKWMFKENSPLVLSAKSLTPEMMAWGLKFLGQCTTAKARENTLNILRLALYSRQVMGELRGQTPVEFNFLPNGILHFFTEQTLLEGAIKQAAFQAEYGAPYHVLSAQQCIEKEPALAGLASQLVGGVFHPEDESGDIHYFTKGLAAQLKNTEFHYNTQVVSLERDGRRIRAVRTNKNRIEADRFVMSLGSYSQKFLQPLGIRSNIYPMKGYSISVPINGKKAPNLSITDQGSKIVYSRLGNIFRAAGTAEFAGHDTTITPKRIEHMKSEMKRVFGDCGDFDKATGWACLRPQTPSGAPVLGETTYDNLYLNTGHGTLGWTLGAGSAKIVADMIEGKSTAISLSGLTL